jgi:hypothetical protein
MSELDDSFAKLLGRQPSDAERQSLYRVRDALGLKNNDALWLVLMALQHYEGLYASIPASIRDAAQKAASGAAAQAKAEVNKAVAALVPSVQQAVKDGARSALANETIGKSSITLVLASLVVGLIFGAGMLYGARIFAAAEQGHLTWPDFWSEVGWSLCLGSAVPGLVMLGFADFAEETQWWQWLVLGFAVLAMGIMGYRLALA